MRKLLVLDSSFSYEAIRARGLEDSVTCRDLDGFFDHVWTVHPFASLVATQGGTKLYGRPEFHSLSSAHTFIDGKVGRYSWLRCLPALNFLAAQFGVFTTLVRLILKEKISVVRVGDPLYLGLLGWMLSRLCSIPLVVRVGANYDKTYETTGRPMQPRLFFTRKIEKLVERFVFPRVDLVAGANQDNLEFAIANGARPECSTLFRYGNLIDRRHFTAPGERGDGQKLLADLGVQPHKFLLYIGRLERVKHPDDVVRVLAEARRHAHDIKAVLVGDGSLRESLLELAHELGVEADVVLCGNRSQQWLAQVIPLAAVVVSPHTGRALSEAALGAAPIAAYDIDWQSEVVKTGSTGELVCFGDWQALAISTIRLLSDRTYSRVVGDNVRRLTLEMMDPARLNQHERDQYEKLLRRR